MQPLNAHVCTDARIHKNLKCMQRPRSHKLKQRSVPPHELQREDSAFLNHRVGSQRRRARGRFHLKRHFLVSSCAEDRFIQTPNKCCPFLEMVPQAFVKYLFLKYSFLGTYFQFPGNRDGKTSMILWMNKMIAQLGFFLKFVSKVIT